jgi:hypothetical protein
LSVKVQNRKRCRTEAEFSFQRMLTRLLPRGWPPVTRVLDGDDVIDGGVVEGVSRIVVVAHSGVKPRAAV